MSLQVILLWTKVLTNHCAEFLLCINPVDPYYHVTSSLLYILCGQVIQPYVNVEMALNIGSEQMIQFQRLWPDGFYSFLSKGITFTAQQKQLMTGIHVVIHQEATCACVISLLVSELDLSFQ